MPEGGWPRRAVTPGLLGGHHGRHWLDAAAIGGKPLAAVLGVMIHRLAMRASLEVVNRSEAGVAGKAAFYLARSFHGGAVTNDVAAIGIAAALKIL